MEKTTKTFSKTFNSFFFFFFLQKCIIFSGFNCVTYCHLQIWGKPLCFCGEKEVPEFLRLFCLWMVTFCMPFLKVKHSEKSLQSAFSSAKIMPPWRVYFLVSGNFNVMQKIHYVVLWRWNKSHKWDDTEQGRQPVLFLQIAPRLLPHCLKDKPGLPSIAF